MEIDLSPLSRAPVRPAAPAGQAAAPAPGKKKKKRAWLVLPACVLVFAAAVLLVISHVWNDPVQVYETYNPYITPYGEVMVSAHRSGGGIFPENTMMAFENCVRSETFFTDIFEFDLHITKDGELILLHDDTLDRTTNSAAAFGVKGARPEDYTLAELRALNFGEGFTDENGAAPYKGLRGDAIPENLRAATLGQVLDLLEKHGGYRYIIEIKNEKALGFAAADRLYRVLRERGLLEKAVVGTFNPEVTRYMDKNYPDMLRSASITEVIGFYLDSLLKLDRAPGYYRYTALQIPGNRFLIKLGTSRLVNHAHKHNIAVQYWTINDADAMRQLKSINADCIMSDVPDLAYAVLRGEA